MGAIMISDELRDIAERLREKGTMSFLDGALEEQISIFEKENGIRLPSKYREWLKFSDGGECYLPAGVQFYGVAHKPLIDIDCNDRPDGKYIVIGALSSGDPILCEREGEKISIYDQEAGIIEDDEIYADFFGFLNDLYDLGRGFMDAEGGGRRPPSP